VAVLEEDETKGEKGWLPTTLGGGDRDREREREQHTKPTKVKTLLSRKCSASIFSIRKFNCRREGKMTHLQAKTGRYFLLANIATSVQFTYTACFTQESLNY